MPQALQNKPIRLVIGFPAGGPIDTVARLLAPHLTEGFGQQVIIDNRAGTTGNLAINPVMYAKLPFDLTHDFAPVSHVASTSSLIYAHPSVSARNLGEFIKVPAAVMKPTLLRKLQSRMRRLSSAATLAGTCCCSREI